MKEPRKDFKLGRLHGKVRAQKTKSEAAIQRIVYQRSVIRIVRSRDEKENTEIRLIAYEMPLGKWRDRCVDLVGYDKDKNLWIIELKGHGQEKLGKVIGQLNGYEEYISLVMSNLEEDFKKTFYFEIKFRKDVKKLILAPKEFYKNSKREEFKDKTIEYAYFKDKNITGEKKLRNIVDVRIEKKSK